MEDWQIWHLCRCGNLIHFPAKKCFWKLTHQPTTIRCEWQNYFHADLTVNVIPSKKRNLTLTSNPTPLGWWIVNMTFLCKIDISFSSNQANYFREIDSPSTLTTIRVVDWKRWLMCITGNFIEFLAKKKKKQFLEIDPTPQGEGFENLTFVHIYTSLQFLANKKF